MEFRLLKVLGRTVLALGAGAAWWWRRRARLATMAEDYRAYWLRRARRPGRLTYVALGDSLAQGVAAPRPEQGFVGLLADELERAGHSVAVRNLSATGATVSDVLTAQLPKLAEMTPDFVTVCVGTNDVLRTALDRFRAEFRLLCARLPAGALVADIPDFQRGPHREAAREYSAACRAVLAEFPELVPVPLERATQNLRIWELGADWAHPGRRGHRRYAAAFLATMAEANAYARLGHRLRFPTG